MWSMTSPDLTIRPARELDAWALDRLAQLDSQRPLAGDVLLAEADGRPVAAVSLADGRATADPFRHTAATVALLRTRAAQVGERAAPAAAGRRRGIITA
jgi:hypothetical protein